MVRQQIDQIYGTDATPPQTPAPHRVANPYEQTLSTEPGKINAEQWKKYHSSWQNYYQKYYEQYYLKEVRRTLEKPTKSQQPLPVDPVQRPATITTEPQAGEQKFLTQKEALDDLRENIRKKAQESAHKARRSKHFVPIASALAVVLVFAFMQYNQVLIANVKAYVSPGDVEAQNIIVDPTATVPVGPETKMVIPKINVDAPIVMDVGPTNADQLKAMSDGIAHVKYPGATSDPGQIGNAVFSAHSSSDWLDSGQYKFIFVQLERMAEGDVVYINYKSVQYAYKVFKIQTVAPTDTSALRYTGSDPIITLITCTPLGTAQHRLLVFAKQISPSPADAKKAPKETTTAPSQMTGNPPTFLERLFGA
jgi:sortase A